MVPEWVADYCLADPPNGTRRLLWWCAYVYSIKEEN